MATSKWHVARLKMENHLLRQAISDAQGHLEIAAGDLHEHQIAGKMRLAIEERSKRFRAHKLAFAHLPKNKLATPSRMGQLNGRASSSLTSTNTCCDTKGRHRHIWSFSVSSNSPHHRSIPC